jgi:hypothetical protein
MNYHKKTTYSRMCIHYPPPPGYISHLTLYNSTSKLESILEISASFSVTSALLLITWGLYAFFIVGKDKTLLSEIQIYFSNDTLLHDIIQKI